MPSPTSSGIRYAHTNLIANDWKALMRFYEEVLGCTPIGAERHAHGPKIDELTAIPNSNVRGRHLRLPGHGENGPTLEIFQYEHNEPTLQALLNRPGFAHLAFEVEDVEAKRDEILRWGGKEVGALISLDIAGAGRLTLVYVTDPEGNILELQRWH